jgi:hypothetical protein
MAPVPLGQFQLQLDEMAACNGYFLMSSIFDITKSTPPITIDLLALIAREAYVEVKENYKAHLQHFMGKWTKKSSSIRGPRNKDAPDTVSVMFAGNRLYISTSTRKAHNTSFTDLFPAEKREQTFIVRALRMAEVYVADTMHHKYQASCSEIVNVHMWSVMNPGLPYEALRDCLIVTAHRRDRTIRVVAPCAPTGCKDVMDVLRMNYHIAVEIPAIRLPALCLGRHDRRSLTTMPSVDTRQSKDYGRPGRSSRTEPWDQTQYRLWMIDHFSKE